MKKAFTVCILLLCTVSLFAVNFVFESTVYGLSGGMFALDNNKNGSRFDDFEQYLSMFGLPGVNFVVTEIKQGESLAEFGINSTNITSDNCMVVGIYSKSSNGKPVNYSKDSSHLFTISLVSPVETLKGSSAEFDANSGYEILDTALYVKYPKGITEDSTLIGYFILEWDDDDVADKEVQILVETT